MELSSRPADNQVVFFHPTSLTKMLLPMWVVSSSLAAHFLVESIMFSVTSTNSLPSWLLNTWPNLNMNLFEVIFSMNQLL